MRPFRVVAILAVGVLVLAAAGCRGSAGAGDEPEYQLAPVLRGDLTVEITSSGSLAYSAETELSFGVSGTVGEVRVEIGDVVEEGQVLASIDTEEWQDYLDGLQDKVDAAASGVESARKAVTSAERSLTSAERKLAASRAGALQAEISVKSAELALKAAQEIPSHRRDEDDIAIKELQVELAVMRLAESENAVLDAEQGIEDAGTAVAGAEDALADARQAEARAVLDLHEAAGTSTELVAPSDGLATGVLISPFDAVRKGRPVVVLSDPGRFEASMMVNEIDILQVRVGDQAMVEVDALPGSSFAATVTSIAPTATSQQGVVNYRVVAGMEPGGGPDARLRAGLSVTVRIITQQRRDVLLVPNQAITSRGGVPVVETLLDGTIVPREIDIGISDWQYTEVLSGLSEGEEVVVGRKDSGDSAAQQPQGGFGFFGGGPGRNR